MGVPLLLLVALFVAVPLAELYLIIQVGQTIGALPTIAILLADSVVGSLLLRSQGRSVWRRFNAAMGSGRVPHREILDGVLVIFGGALLLTPGFLTDVFGLALLFPPTRAIARSALVRVAGRRIIGGVVGDPGPLGPRPRSRTPYDVDGTAREAPPRPPRLP